MLLRGSLNESFGDWSNCADDVLDSERQGQCFIPLSRSSYVARRPYPPRLTIVMMPAPADRAALVFVSMFGVEVSKLLTRVKKRSLKAETILVTLANRDKSSAVYWLCGYKSGLVQSSRSAGGLRPEARARKTAGPSADRACIVRRVRLHKSPT